MTQIEKKVEYEKMMGALNSTELYVIVFICHAHPLDHIDPRY
jgi:hypothetical protein